MTPAHTAIVLSSTSGVASSNLNRLMMSTLLGVPLGAEPRKAGWREGEGTGGPRPKELEKKSQLVQFALRCCVSVCALVLIFVTWVGALRAVIGERASRSW